MLALASLVLATATPCVLGTGAQRVHALCDAIDVDVGGDSASGAQSIRIGYAVVKSKAKEPAPDPVIFLAGGPGQSATDVAGSVMPVLHGINANRDVVFFDARGTGRSTPLRCDDARTLEQRFAATTEEDLALLAACMKAQPFDLRTLTTERVARDLDRVRERLGAAQVNLVGVSYGTRLALAYDHLFPGRVRAMVLDGVVPATMRVGETLAADADAALDAVQARCEATPGCPHEVRAHLRSTLERLDAAPGDVVIAHPRTGAPLHVTLRADAVRDGVRSMLYAEELQALIPFALAEAALGRLTPLAALLVSADAMGGEQLSVPVNLAILCAEDVREGFSPPAASPFVTTRNDPVRTCALVPHASLPPASPPTSPSPTPALLLSGAADPITPPARATEAQKFLSHARAVTFAGTGHNVFARGCAPKLLEQFLVRGSADDVDVSCAARYRGFPPFIDAMGPPP